MRVCLQVDQDENVSVMGSSDQQKEHSGVSGSSSLDGTLDDNHLAISRGSSSGGCSGPTTTCNTNSIRRGRASPVCGNTGRLSLARFSEERRARRCRFYRNGDLWFPGVVVAVAGERHRTWETLLADLTRILDHPLHLASGVRNVFNLEGNRLNNLDQLTEGGEYVASSAETLKLLDYRKIRLPQWRIHAKRKEALHVTSRPHVLSPTHTPATTPGSEAPLLVTSLSSSSADSLKDIIKPKLITVIRNGVRPRKAIRILLNHRTARSFEQVLNNITEAIKLDSGAVRKIYSLDGHQIVSLRDFFHDEDMYLAYGSERCYHDDFDLDNEECRQIQPLVKMPLPPRRLRRMASPKPRGRAISPLAIFDGPGSLPRSPRKGRPQSPFRNLRHSPLPPEEHSNGHVPHTGLEGAFPSSVTKKYQVGKILGDGNFAVVRKCVNKKTLEEFALKIIDKDKCHGKEHLIDSEVSILRQVNHSHIVSLIEEFNTNKELYLVMELVEGGDLFDAIASATKYTERDASCMISDLSSALHYLHLRNIVHRDIKPENLLVFDRKDGSKSLKLGDFGLAIEVVEPLFSVCGTPTYVAPEILAESGYGLKVDIWAAGVITYILLCGFPPFVSATNNQEELFEQILRGNYEFHAPYWNDVSDAARELIVNMIVIDPNLRYTAKQVLQHPWVAATALNQERKHFSVYSCAPNSSSACLTLVNNSNNLL